ncbi:MAG: hypothetical protein ACJ72H_07285 [Candidatus Sulfotelmatobacter sp.]
MRNNAALIAAFTALVAFMGISSLPRGGTERSAASDLKTSTKAPLSKKSNAAAQAKRASPACEEIARRLRVFVYPENFKEIGSEACVPTGPRMPPDVRFVIATVPNPISTHLALFFDRAVDTIQQAAEDESYSYDSSWFPWSDVSNEFPLLIDRRTAQAEQDATEHQPGIIVFRGGIDGSQAPYQRGLVVFLVSETPTGGIDRTEFQNSMMLVEKLGGLNNAANIRVLGPMFSGSVPSLYQTLEPFKLSHPGFQVSLFSGTVSSQDAYRWFSERLQGWGTFRTALPSDQAMLDEFMSYLVDQGYGRGCVAIISEDETAFGNSPGEVFQTEADKTSQGRMKTPGKEDGDKQGRCDLFGQNPKPIYLYYPRDIATLRSAYERQSIFNSKRQNQESSSPPTALRGDLTEPENSNHDTVRSYAGQLTPLAQEAVLQSIAHVIKEKAIQFIVVRSTNSLDQVFLAEFFRRSNPESRVVLDGSDPLFKRGAEGASLRGVMTLSAYPLLTPWQQDWTVALRYAKNGSYRVFGDDVAEGLYVAAREQFQGDTHSSAENRLAGKAAPTLECNGEQNNPANGPGIPVNEYGPPQWPGLKSANENWQRPGIWLSVISHRQFWPMAFLDSVGNKEMPAPTDLTRDTPVPADEINHPPFRFPIELIVLFALGFLWAACHLRWCWRGSSSPGLSSSGLSCFSPMRRPQHSGLIAFGCLLPALLAVVTAAAGGLFGSGLDPTRRLIFSIWVIGVLAMCIFACLRNYSLPICSTTDRASNRVRFWQRIVGVSAAVVLIGMTILQLVFVTRLRPENEIPTYWRAIHLINGVSPLTPQLLLLVGLYLWFWYSLRGLALFGPDRPSLPKDSSLPPLMRMFGRTHAAKWVEREAIPGRRTYFISLGVTFVAVFAVFAFSMESFALRTLGERTFGVYMFVWFALCVAMILADMLQLWMTWKHLHHLLQRLDRLPLRRTLASLKGLSWSSVWRMSSSVLEDRYCLISRQMESLTHLLNSIRRCPTSGKGREKSRAELKRDTKAAVLRQIRNCRCRGLEFANWYVSMSTTRGSGKHADGSSMNVSSLTVFQKSLAETAAYILVAVLLPAWKLESKSLIIDSGGPFEKGTDPKQAFQDGNADSANTQPGFQQELPGHVAAAEEFVVLPFVAFIQNVLGRVRTMVLGSLFLFVAVTFAASSYPFDPLPVLGATFLGVFVIAGGISMMVLAQMHRDATLSYITHTQPGELGPQFWIHLITFGVGPLIGLLTTLFPALTDFVASWLQPNMQVLQ